MNSFNVSTSNYKSQNIIINATNTIITKNLAWMEK